MKATAITLAKVTTTTALAAALLANSVVAANTSFSDYARVVHVEPAYRYVTINKPQRICTPDYRPRQPNHRPHRRNNTHTRTNTYRHDSTGAVFIGGLIGGAIGREVSKSVNGRPSTGATITGAIIGSTLAGAAAQSNGGYRDSTSHPSGNYGHNRHYVTSTQQHSNRSNRSGHRVDNRAERQRPHYRQRAHDNNNGHKANHRRAQRCTTSTQTSRERRADGYHVTYMYKGRTFNTHTLHHPGRRIQVEINLTPVKHGR